MRSKMGSEEKKSNVTEEIEETKKPKRSLNDQELEQVSGGTGPYSCFGYLPQAGISTKRGIW